MKALIGTIGIFWLSLDLLLGQGVFVSRFRPANYLSNNRHLVEIQHAGRGSTNLEGYLLVTRDYSVRLPRGANVSAGSKFRIGKTSTNENPLDLELAGMPDFLIRFHLMENEGNYVALLDRNGKMVDGFYYAPEKNVPFLPDRDTSITFSGLKIPFSLPPENRSSWSYLNSRDEPGLDFVLERGTWKKIADRSILEATRCEDVTLRYFEGIVSVKWSTRFESGVEGHFVERSLDQENFEEIGNVSAKGNTQERNLYAYYDDQVALGKNYFYRIRSQIKGKEDVYSKVVSLKIQEGEDPFSMEAILVPYNDGTELNLRFTSLYAQDIRIKLLDERMAEVAILFQGYVNAREPKLLKVSRRLGPGKYLILTSTEGQRFGKEIFIR